jgi:predicted alpha/beta superfamily hydrolase
MKVKKDFRLSCGCLLIGVLLAGALPGQDNKIVVGENARLFSKVLNEERTLQISRPAGYESGNKAYPVVMTLDGGMTFRFTADIARYLAANGLMPEVIVVGIPNTNRNRDFIPELPAGTAPGGGPEAMRSGKADNFLKFLQQEAMPYIENNLRTLPYRVIVGHSLGGLFIVHSLLKDSGFFSAYMALSPSLWWNNWSYFEATRQFYKSRDSLKKIVFVTLADEAENDPQQYARLEDAFEKNAPQDLSVEVRIYPDKNHITTAVEATLDGLFKIFSPWVLSPELVTSGDIPAIKTYYRKLSDKLGFAYSPPEGAINQAGYMKLGGNETEKAIGLFLFNTELYPDSANAFDSLAEAYLKTGSKQLAIDNYKKALKLDPQLKSAIDNLKKLAGN